MWQLLKSIYGCCQQKPYVFPFLWLELHWPEIVLRHDQSPPGTMLKFLCEGSRFSSQGSAQKLGSLPGWLQSGPGWPMPGWSWWLGCCPTSRQQWRNHVCEHGSKIQHVPPNPFVRPHFGLPMVSYPVYCSDEKHPSSLDPSFSVSMLHFGGAVGGAPQLVRG